MKLKNIVLNILRKYACPREFEFRDELPKTLVGKVAYRILEQEEEEKNAEYVAMRSELKTETKKSAKKTKERYVKYLLFYIFSYRFINIFFYYQCLFFKPDPKSFYSLNKARLL